MKVIILMDGGFFLMLLFVFHIFSCKHGANNKKSCIFAVE